MVVRFFIGYLFGLNIFPISWENLRNKNADFVKCKATNGTGVGAYCAFLPTLHSAVKSDKVIHACFTLLSCTLSRKMRVSDQVRLNKIVTKALLGQP